MVMLMGLMASVGALLGGVGLVVGRSTGSRHSTKSASNIAWAAFVFGGERALQLNTSNACIHALVRPSKRLNSHTDAQPPQSIESTS